MRLFPARRQASRAQTRMVLRCFAVMGVLAAAFAALLMVRYA